MEEVNIQFINLKQAITHHIGNKHNGEDVKLSEMASNIKPESADYLVQYFFKPIPWAEYFTFGEEEEDRADNYVYNEIKALFDNPENWIQHSKNLAHQLYECSDHPQIKAGEFNLVMFENLTYDDMPMPAIGLFKSTSRKPFLRMEDQGKNFELRHHLGYGLGSLDQACLILKTDVEEGFRVFAFDNTGATSDAVYWKKNFLNIKACDSEFHKTAAYMNMAKNFLTQKIDEDFDVDRVDKIDLLNRSADYFKNKEHFVKEDFEQEVFADESVIESFREFNNKVGLQNKLVLEDSFDISEPAVKREARGFKSVLKLDKNFHVYIHGNRNLIQKGSDEDGKKFYKIYYDVEK